MCFCTRIREKSKPNKCNRAITRELSHKVLYNLKLFLTAKVEEIIKVAVGGAGYVGLPRSMLCFK